MGGLEAVLEYLGRYTHRVAVSNERILGIDGNDGNDVLLRVRADPTSGKKRTLRAPGTEFIDCFLEPVLSAGFKRIRHDGLLSPARKKDALAAARAAPNGPPPEPAVIESVADFRQRVARIEQARCPHCGLGECRGVSHPSASTRSAEAARASWIVAVLPCSPPQSDGSAIRGVVRLICGQALPRPSRSPLPPLPRFLSPTFPPLGEYRSAPAPHPKRLTLAGPALQSP
ncbi:MAG: transposase [Accumulibacter sp.]